MRRFAHLAILPAMFMIFTEVESQMEPKRDHPIVIDMEGAVVVPNTNGTTHPALRGKSVVRPLRGSAYVVTAPFENILARLKDASGHPGSFTDLSGPDFADIEGLILRPSTSRSSANVPFAPKPNPVP